jgi:hypothetical protein
MYVLDKADILNLLSARDPVGYLSIYLHIDPREQDRMPWQIFLKDQLHMVENTLRERSRADWVAYKGAIDSAQAALEQLQDPRLPGVGRALYLALSTGDIETVSLQIPFQDRVVIDHSPYIRPLVQVWDDGKPSGCLILGRDGARIGEWQYGRYHELASLSLDSMREEYEEAGFIRRRPLALPKQVATNDKSKRRGAHYDLFLQVVAKSWERVQREKGWSRALLYGHAPWRTSLLHNIHTHPHDLFREIEAMIYSEHDLLLAERINSDYAQWNRERENDLVQEIVSGANGAGRGILGVSQVIGALEQGRVEHLAYCADTSINLTKYPTNGFVPEGKDPALGIEILVEAALQTGARVTPIEDDSARVLSKFGSVGALLRW